MDEIVEMRTYTLVPGATAAYFSLYEAEGLATQREHLGEMFGYYATEVGHVNTVVHLWRYPSFEERTRRRDALKACLPREDVAAAPRSGIEDSGSGALLQASVGVARATMRPSSRAAQSAR
jgi:hypothetical protein